MLLLFLKIIKLQFNMKLTLLENEKIHENSHLYFIDVNFIRFIPLKHFNFILS